MTVVPTEYDLQQDARITPLEDTLAKAAQPPTGPEFSYPVVGQAMSDSMWQWVTKGVGNGIIDRNTYPYWLQDFRDSDNTALLTKGWDESANAIVEGFYHQLNEDKRLELPMPLTGSVTYNICLTYDPRNHKEPRGPVSIQVHTGTPPTTHGRVNVILWTVQRQASQLLSDATVTRRRPRVSPVIYVWEEEDKPDPGQVLFGSLCYVGRTGMVYRSGGAGDPDDPDSGANPSWVPFRDRIIRPDSTAYEWPGHGARFRSTRFGTLVVLEGRVSRVGGENFSAGNSYHIRTLPERHRPNQERRFITKTSGYANGRTATINISTNGEVHAYPDSNTAWLGVDGICYTVD